MHPASVTALVIALAPSGVPIEPSRAAAGTKITVRVRPALEDKEADLIQAAGGPKAGTYGFLTPDGFDVFARHVRLTADDMFVDLGSGDGALVIRAAAEYGARAAGIELAQSRHAQAVQGRDAMPASAASRCVFVCDDAAGDAAAELLQEATVVWCSNLCFNEELQQKIASRIGAAPRVRALATLSPFPEDVRGLAQQDCPLLCRMSWSGLAQAGYPPLPGHPCIIYLRA
jgi:hypothetical protein